jgi:outer membrane protein assembly factor BamB
MKVIALLPLCFWFLSTPVRAEPPKYQQNWHQWRGPLATGIAPNGDPPIKWDEKANLKWKVAIPGRGSATPIVWEDHVFVVTAIDTGKQAAAADLPKSDSAGEKRTKAPTTYHQFVVLCLERNTGRIRWQRVASEQVPHEGHHDTHSYAAASPTTDGRYLYVSFGSRGIYCYDFSGNLQWQQDLGDMDTRLGWGEGISPVIHGNSLIVNWDHEGPSFIVALDARTGQTRWRAERDERSSWATPVVVEHRGRTQVIVNATNRVRSYDLATGEVIWQHGGQTVNVIPSPIVADGVAFCMSGYRGAVAQAISLDAQADITDTGELIWQHDRGTPYVPSPLLYGDRLYFTQGNNAMLTCLDAKTGKPILDRVRLPGLSSLYASPAGAQDRIYLVGRDGTALVIKRADTLELLATNKLDDPIDASPAIAGKQLFLRGEKHLYCLEQE